MSIVCSYKYGLLEFCRKRKDYLAQVRKLVESDDEGIEDDEEEMESSSSRQRRKKGCKRHMANQVRIG